MPDILYFVHDITHPDVPRRVKLLQDGGARVVLVGFQRRQNVDWSCADEVISLGLTIDANFTQRIKAVLKATSQLKDFADKIRSSDTIVARNLEMLFLGWIARQRHGAGQPLVYECLDIHRLMVGDGMVSKVLRGIEGFLMSKSAGLVISSPGFEREYFNRRYKRLPSIELIENKVYPEVGGGRLFADDRPRGKPWRIGWYGVIRCRQSLELLTEACAKYPDLLEVVMAGRPARGVISKEELAGRPGITYLGEFDTEEQLGEIIRSLDFTWTVDFYESDANSLWLLPNRLYRSIYYGVPPLAMSYVETGHWLNERKVGLVLDKFDLETVVAGLKGVTAEQYDKLAKDVRAIPTRQVLTDQAECRAIVASWVDPSLMAEQAS